MTDQSHHIAQIHQTEADAKQIIQKAESDNNKSISAANDEAASIISAAEEAARQTATLRLNKDKEAAKAEYKKILVDADNERRSVVDGAKSNASKAEAIINNAFLDYAVKAA